MTDMPSNVLLDQVADWLIERALAGAGLDEIVSGFCERLAACGLPIARIHLTFSVLHPLYRAAGFTWRRGLGVQAEGYRHVAASQSDRFTKSPYYYLLQHKLGHLRRRIDPSAESEFPIFDDLKAEGITDYIAFAHSFGEGMSQGMLGSWASDRKEGFSDPTISALLRMQNQLAVAARMAVLGRLADNTLTTYLGNEAGRRVLSGQIKRGDGETVRAAIVIADMRNSTRLAEELGRQAYIDTLNIFFDTIATPFNRAGGQILSFLGDGFLAIYPCDRHRKQSEIACRAALAAATVALSRMGQLNQRRHDAKLWEIGFGIGLHVGNVMFGNVGLADRLTYSVFGSAVNETQRLESLTKKFEGNLVASDTFADYCGGAWIELGRERLRGRQTEMAVFRPDPKQIIATDDALDGEGMSTVLSDAEHLFMLHRQQALATGEAPQS